jgi:hypothetical protein
MIGGRMGVIGTPPTVRPTLDISGIFKTLDEYRSESDALEAAG